MSNNVTASLLLVSRSGLNLKQASMSVNQTLTTDVVISNDQVIGTSDETLTLGDVAAGGFIAVINNDATNYVEIDSASTYDKFPQKIYPGCGILLNPETVVIHAKANTAPVTVTILACGPKA